MSFESPNAFSKAETTPLSEVRREDRAEVLLRFLGRVPRIDAFEGRPIEEVFSAEESRRRFIETVSVEEAGELLNGLSGILRDKGREEWKPDGDHVALKGDGGLSSLSTEYVPPEQEDKRELFTYLLEALRELSRRSEDLERIGVLLGAGINALHMYEDGNGRLSRVGYELVAHGYDENRLLEVLGEDGRFAVDLSQEPIQRDLERLVARQHGTHRGNWIPEENGVMGFGNQQGRFLEAEEVRNVKFSEVLSPEMQAAFKRVLFRDLDTAWVAVSAYFENTFPEEWLHSWPSYKRVRLDFLTENMYPHDVEKILDMYRQLKREYVELLIDCFVNPEKEEYRLRIGGEETTLRDELVRGVEGSKEF